MTSPHLTSSVRHVIEAASLAPSVHNTQPWRFVVREDGFDLLADPGRQLSVLDPTGRQLHLSCGAALVTARVAGRALGLDTVVTLLPDADDPSLLARLRLVPGNPASDRDIALALAVLRRHTVREAFEPRAVEPELLEELRRGRTHGGVEVEHGFDDARERGTVALGQWRDASVADEDAELGVSLGLVKRWLERTELKDEAAEGPDIGFASI